MVAVLLGLGALPPNAELGSIIPGLQGWAG